MAPANVPGALTVSASDLATKWAVTSASVSQVAGSRARAADFTMSLHRCTVQSCKIMLLKEMQALHHV